MAHFHTTSPNTLTPVGPKSDEDADTAYVDVAIIGAGISGISAAYHLTTNCPDRSFTMLEQRSNLGGTWDLFRYPGVRSDSDMHTLGFRFAPWKHEKRIADGPSILEYLHETVDRFDLRDKIRFDHKITSAAWSSAQARWTLTMSTKTGVETLSCNVLFVCAGYYSYRAGHTPDFEGIDDFEGRVIHPQQWPEDLDVSGEKVVVIGSGATAVTLIPALAEDADSVTMLQRSATFVVSQSSTDPFALWLRKRVPDRVGYGFIRARNIARDQLVYLASRRTPNLLRRELLRRVRDAIGGELTDEHFTPKYQPWDQRLCLVPDGDFFKAINNGTASVVTGQIDTVTSSGIRLDGGEHLEADIIVTATGLALTIVGEIDVFVDGNPVDFADTVLYRGVGYSGVPNLFSTFGYVNASWTLRADMVSRYVCRLLNEMSKVGAKVATPTLRPSDREATRYGWIEDFSAGYVTRGLPMLPSQLDREPWRNHQNFLADQKSLLYSPIEDGVMVLS